MFSDTKSIFMQNIQPGPGTYSACNFMESSFPSDSSLESFVESGTSAPRMSFGSFKAENTAFATPTPNSTPERYAGSTELLQMGSMNNDMLSGYQESSMHFSRSGAKLLSGQDMMRCHGLSTYEGSLPESFVSIHGLPIMTPSLDIDLYSPSSSPVSVDFVVPSQTTFLKSFDLQSPLRSIKPLQFDLHYDDSPSSDYASDYSLRASPAGNNRYCIQSYAEFRSPSASPCRSSSIRQPIFEALQTSTALHRIQEQAQGKAQRHIEAIRHVRKRAKRVVLHSGLPSNIRVEKQAKKQCMYEGCVARFKRQEHLKRHEKTHDKHLLPFSCQFCEKQFGRTDNLKSHIKLHTIRDNGGKNGPRRTEYCPGALRVYQEMSRKPRKSEDRAKPKGMKELRSRAQEH
jgi:zinc finger protein BrlA